MPAVTKEQKQVKTSVQPVLRPWRDKVVDIYHPYINRLRLLSKTAKKLANGPIAYRGAEFARWHKDTTILYSEFNKKGMSPVFKQRFLGRRFGRSKNVLTETQIYNLFKADMLATLRDFQRIMLALQRKRQSLANPLARAGMPWPLQKTLFLGTGLWWAIGFAVLALGIGLLFLLF